MIDLPPLAPASNLGKYNLFGLGFRPFFLFASGWAVIAILLWMLSLSGMATPSFYVDAYLWHRHEMLIGMGSALAAGFLLTAVRNWTKISTPTGWTLAGLASIWLLGRLVWLSGDALSPLLVLLADSLFLPWLIYAIGKPIWQRRQWHQWSFPAILIALLIANLGMHLSIIESLNNWLIASEKLAIYALLGLLMVMAGRITPFFTEKGCDLRLTPTPNLLIKATFIGYACVALLDISQTMPPIMAILALLTGMLLLTQGYYWQSWRTGRNPLVWVLHLGYTGLGLGFLLLAYSTLDSTWQSSAYHGWLAMAMGGIGLGMMARVSLGHSGRILTTLSGMRWVFGLVIVGGLLRSVAPLSEYLLWLASSAWVLAFMGFWLRYLPIWLQTRPDGRPD